MKTKPIRPESLDEIVFHHRNQSYGAYALRKEYKRSMIISLIIALLVAAGILSYPLVTAVYGISGYIDDEERGINITMAPPPDEKPEPIAPPPPPPDIQVEKLKLQVPVVVDDTSAGNELFIQDILAEKGNDEVPEEPGEELRVEEIKKPEIIETDELPPPELVVQEMPQFPDGGDAAFRKYIVENLKFPAEAKELGISGIVYVEFIVEANGSISGVKLLRGIHTDCDREALRVIESMPYWIPGRQQGHPVRVRLAVPIRFTLITS